MATVKTHDLIKCNRVNDVLPSVNNPGLIPYNGLFVKFDGQDNKSYKVRKNVQGRFLDGIEATEVYDVQWSVTSLKFNGVEFISAPAGLQVSTVPTPGSELQIQTAFPYYTVGNEYNYTSNVANGIIVSDSLTDTGNNTNNYYRFIENLVNFYGIPVKVSKSPALWWFGDDYPRLANIIFEKYYDDDFEFTVIQNKRIISTGAPTEVNTYRHVFNGATSQSYLNSVLITTPTDAAQYNEEFSFFSYDFIYDTIEEIDNCPTSIPFNTSLETDNCANIQISCDCRKITFADNSVYDNTMPGHDPELFTSRTIILTRPDGSKYIWGTSDIADRDVTIQPHFNSPNTFSYNFIETDKDGIYTIQLCTYPNWSNAVLYDAYLQTIVLSGGKLYKCIATNTNLDPATNPSYWQEYICTDNCDITRYCTTEKVIVLCISLLRCYKKLVADAFCSIDANPCKPVCENKSFMDAMKFRVTLDALEFAVCARDWAAVKNQVDVLNSICCCI
jgi:hypothetical protein